MPIAKNIINKIILKILHHPLDALVLVKVLDGLEIVVQGAEHAWTWTIRICNPSRTAAPTAVRGFDDNPVISKHL